MAQSNLTAQQQAVMKRALELAVTLTGEGPAVMAGVDLGAQFQSTRDGLVPAARLKLATNPTANDTITVGGHVFKWVAALGAQAAQTQIKIGADAAAAQALFVKALNGTADSANILEGTTSFKDHAAASGWALFADAPGSNQVRIRQCAAGFHGQVAYVQAMAPASIALARSLTAAGDVWNCANINEFGQAPGKRLAYGALTITATVKAFGSATIELPFTPDPKSLVWMRRDSSGIVTVADEAVTVSSGNKSITVTLAGGGSPNFQTNDVFAFWISEA